MSRVEYYMLKRTVMMVYRGLQVVAALVLAMCCGAAYGATAEPALSVVHERIVDIEWGKIDDIAFSPDGKYLAVTGSPDQWDKYEAQLAAYYHRIVDPVVRPTPTQWKKMEAYEKHLKKECPIAIWRVADWNRVATPQMDAYYRYPGHVAIAWMPNSTSLAVYAVLEVGGLRNYQNKARISIWSRDGWRLLSTSITADVNGYYLNLSPDGGSFILPGGNDVKVWNSRTGALSFSVNVNVDPTETTRQPDAYQRRVAYSSDGKYIVADYGDLVCLIDVSTRAVVGWRRMPDMVYNVKFQPHTHTFLVMYGSYSYQLLYAPMLIPKTSRVVNKDATEGYLHFSSDGKWFIVSSGSGVTMVETASMRPFRLIGPFTEPAESTGSGLAFSSDGSKLAMGFLPYPDRGYGHEKGRLVVFRTSKPGEPTPDEWLKTHPGKPAPPPIGRWPRPRKPTATVRPAVPAPPAPTPAPKAPLNVPHAPPVLTPTP